MEDRVPDPPLAGVPVHAAELCVWPHARQVESLCAGFLDRHDAGHGDVCVSRLAGQCRRRASPAHDRGMGVIRRRPGGKYCGDGIRHARGEESIGKEDQQRQNWPQPAAFMSAHTQSVVLTPADTHNARLVSNVHPPNWQNPPPAPCYNLVVIGAGTAGLVTAAGAAGLGAKVALVEKSLLGGDCLNVGCVPSKALIRSGRVVFDAKEAGPFGVRVSSPVEIDFPAVMERLRKLRADLSPNDSAQRFAKLGVDVFLGEARFAGRDTVAVAGQTLRFKRAVIATGARPMDPPIPGLAEVGYLTNETVFTLTRCPARLAVIGGGPIGCELAQVFQRLGSQVSLLHKNAHLLDREDMEAAALVQKAFIREGIALRLNGTITRVERSVGGNSSTT